MLARLTTEQQFYSWVNSEDPDKRYFWPNRIECACGRFLQEVKGFTVKDITPDMFGRYANGDCSGGWGAIKEVWRFNRIAQGDYCEPEDWTFGKLAQRIRERMPECVV